MMLVEVLTVAWFVGVVVWALAAEPSGAIGCMVFDHRRADGYCARCGDSWPGSAPAQHGEGPYRRAG